MSICAHDVTDPYCGAYRCIGFGRDYDKGWRFQDGAFAPPAAAAAAGPLSEEELRTLARLAAEDERTYRLTVRLLMAEADWKARVEQAESDTDVLLNRVRMWAGRCERAEAALRETRKILRGYLTDEVIDELLAREDG